MCLCVHLSVCQVVSTWEALILLKEVVDISMWGTIRTHFTPVSFSFTPVGLHKKLVSCRKFLRAVGLTKIWKHCFAHFIFVDAIGNE